MRFSGSFLEKHFLVWYETISYIFLSLALWKKNHVFLVMSFRCHPASPAIRGCLNCQSLQAEVASLFSGGLSWCPLEAKSLACPKNVPQGWKPDVRLPIFRFSKIVLNPGRESLLAQNKRLLFPEYASNFSQKRSGLIQFSELSGDGPIAECHTLLSLY